MPSFFRWTSDDSTAGLVFVTSTAGDQFEKAIREATDQKNLSITSELKHS